MSSSLEARIAAAKREIRAQSLDGIIRRTLPTEVRTVDTPDGGYKIIGHGAVYNSMSQDLGGFREMIQPGFFNRAVSQSPDAKVLFNHDPNWILAATNNNSMRLLLDSTGLGYEGDVSPAVAATQPGQYVRAILADGLVNQSSFAFRIGAGGDNWTEDAETGGLLRTLLPDGCSGLYDCSPVTYPAYLAADAGLSRARVMAEVRALGAMTEKRVDAPSANIITSMIDWGTWFCDQEDDADAISHMTSVLVLLNNMLGVELTEPADADSPITTGAVETNSSPSLGERKSAALSGERDKTASNGDGRADTSDDLASRDRWMAEQMRLGRA